MYMYCTYEYIYTIDPKIRDERPENESPIENGSIPPNYRPDEADSTGRVSGTLTDTASYRST